MWSLESFAFTYVYSAVFIQILDAVKCLECPEFAFQIRIAGVR